MLQKGGVMKQKNSSLALNQNLKRESSQSFIENNANQNDARKLSA